MRRSIFPLLSIWLVSCLAAACFSENNTAILWSDRPEFAFYAEYYNAVQTQYKIEMRYYDYLSQKLAETASGNRSACPDIIAGSWLKSTSTRVFFRPMDKHFKDVLENDSFYSRLLILGNIDGRQYLLPVSYNAPLIIFARNRGGQLSNPFTIGFTEMKTLGKNYNVVTRGIYTRMGFSPAWDDNFLYITAELFDASFREDNPLAWNAAELEKAMRFACEWTNEANTGIQSVDDFTFKYFYEPPARLVESGRILFACMDSDVYFTLAEDQRRNLDFRWLAERDTIPLAERSVYIGLAKKGKSPKAAETFLRWFIRTDTQRYILEKSRQNRTDETSFGIGGGFSAMRAVTEQVFPQFYPDMLGRMPPQEFLSPANILPSNWITLKERVVLPYLSDCVRQPDSGDIIPLERRIADWQRINR